MALLKDIIINDDVFDWETALIEQARTDGFPLIENKQRREQKDRNTSISPVQFDGFLVGPAMSHAKLQEEIRAACAGNVDTDLNALLKEIQLNERDVENANGKGYDSDLDTSGSIETKRGGQKHCRHFRSDVPDLSFLPMSSDSANSSPLRKPWQAVQEAPKVRGRVRLPKQPKFEPLATTEELPPTKSKQALAQECTPSEQTRTRAQGSAGRRKFGRNMRRHRRMH